MSSGCSPLIAHVISRFDIGGLENGLVNLINHMPAQRYRHAIVCLTGFDADFRARVDRPDVAVVSINKKPGKDPGAYQRMWRELRRLRPDVVHTRNLGTVDMQWLAAAAGVRHRVHGEHGWDAADPKGLSRRGLCIRRSCRPVIHRFVPMSRDIGHWLEWYVGVAPSRIRQIYSGVDARKFCPVPDDGEAAAKSDVVTIGTVGRLDPVKNQATLLRAFASIHIEWPEVRLTIVGDGPLRASLVQLARDLGIERSVSFTGARSDVPEVMRQFDVFALPSHNEGVSNTILEAMATGLPVVASRVGGNPELVSDGVTGCLYEAAEHDGLRLALLQYLRDPGLRRAHGKAGRERVLRDFSLEAMVDRYLNLYDELFKTSAVIGATRRA